VLDALPVERFVRRDAGVQQQRVHAGHQGFGFVESAAPEGLASSVENIEREIGEQLPDGYVSEVCIALPDWIGQLSGSLHEGVVLLFDYGVSRREYYARERSEGWLRCHFRHHAHNNPLIMPGIQDLTAWVDFTGVAAAAAEAGFDVAGYSTQAQFLMAGGLDEEMQGFGMLSLEGQLKLSRQIKTLTLPGEMGEHFKCMALRKGSGVTPSAFDLADRTHTL
jgi:SAM-dependent MidA family methyltransferase